MFETPVVAIRPPERPAFPPFVQYNDDNLFLTPEQCQKVIDHAESGKLTRGSIGNGGNSTFYEDLEYRMVRMRSLQADKDDLGWLFEIVRDRVQWTNDEFFRFDLHGLLEGMQYLRYDEGSKRKPSGHYRWHQDYGGGYSSHRKLSVVIQLSDPSEYDGCELRLFTAGEHGVPTVNQGSGVIFPSWQPHCVTPLVRGVRRSLVCWVSGPQFR